VLGILEDLGVGGRIILNRVLEKNYPRRKMGFRKTSENIMVQLQTLGLSQMKGICQPCRQLQEALHNVYYS
jgi:hypothetical protein